MRPASRQRAAPTIHAHGQGVVVVPHRRATVGGPVGAVESRRRPELRQAAGATKRGRECKRGGERQAGAVGIATRCSAAGCSEQEEHSPHAGPPTRAAAAAAAAARSPPPDGRLTHTTSTVSRTVACTQPQQGAQKAQAPQAAGGRVSAEWDVARGSRGARANLRQATRGSSTVAASNPPSEGPYFAKLSLDSRLRASALCCAEGVYRRDSKHTRTAPETPGGQGGRAAAPPLAAAQVGHAALGRVVQPCFASPWCPVIT